MELDEALERFHEYILFERNLSPNTVSSYMSDLNSLLAHLTASGLVEISEVQDSDLLAWLQKQSAEGHVARSRARGISACRQFFKFLRRNEWLQTNPTATLDSPIIPKTLPEVLEPEEIDEILAIIPHDAKKPRLQRDRAMIELMFSCGLRVSELVNLSLSDLHLNEGFILVRGKGDKERLVPIGPKAITTLEDYMHTARLAILKNPGNSTQVLFVNPAGKALSRMGFWKILQRYAKGAGLAENVHPHLLRHSFATALLRGGADLRSVQTMLGHASITTTEIYTNLDNRDLRNVVNRAHPLSRKNSKK